VSLGLELEPKEIYDMKTTIVALPSGLGLFKPFVIVAALLLGLMANPLQGQQITIDWHKIAGGGGTSTNGPYSLSGTLGQHDAGGPMTGGAFSLTGGFWVLPTAVQVTNAPTLTIALGVPGQARISWAPNTPGFVLQEASSLAPANWTNSPSGATNPVVVPALLPMKFYRLCKP
jgi:hypothetical protein